MLSPDRRNRAGPVARRGATRFPVRAESDQLITPRIGIRFPQQLSYENWLAMGRQLAALHTSSAWCLGDWLIHGEDSYSGRYRDAVKRTSLDYHTLRNYAWVARRFTLSRRQDALSFAHHAEVAGLPVPEQDFWLRKARELSWSRNYLRREVRASRAQRAIPDARTAIRSDSGSGQAGPENKSLKDDRAPDQPVNSEIRRGAQPAAVGVRIQVKLSPGQLESCRVAAGEFGHGIEEWAAFALEQAALEQLGRKTRH
jgi:hypothetical protein